MKHITKAIIPVAGWGTRRLPITKVVEKCMLPIGNRPLVDYVVEDCLKAGISEIIFVVGEQSTQIRGYYSSNVPLNDYLTRNGKTDLLPLVAPLENVTIHFVVQPGVGKYGTAVPVAMAASYIDEGESAVVLMGDDFIYNIDGSSETARLIEATTSGGSAMTGVEVPLEEVGRYGVIELNEKNEFVRIVEKPAPEDAPSTLINISKYVLDHEALQCVKRYVATEKTGEYFITDPLNTYVQSGGILKVVRSSGKYMDGGTVDGWLQANLTILGQ